MPYSYQPPRRTVPGSTAQLVIVGVIVVVGVFCGLPSFALWAQSMKQAERNDKATAKEQLAAAKALPVGRYTIVYPMHQETLTQLIVERNQIKIIGIADTTWYACVSAVKDIDAPRHGSVIFLDGSLATLTSATCDDKTGRRVLVFTADRRFGATFTVGDGTLGNATITVTNGKVKSCPDNYAEVIADARVRDYCAAHPFAAGG